MFDKWKAKRELCKAFNFYRKKKKSYLRTTTISIYEQLHEIEYAIAYVLCEYFDFNYEFYYDFPFSYKWNIAYDYIHCYDECKKAYKNNTNHIQEFNLIKPLKGKVTDKQYNIFEDGNYITTLTKGDMYFDMANNKYYMFNGKNFIEIC